MQDMLPEKLKDKPKMLLIMQRGKEKKLQMLLQMQLIRLLNNLAGAGERKTIIYY